MGLDLTDSHRYNSDVHFRRYLGRDDAVVVVCVQDFDYHGYVTSRFLDRQAFSDEDAAQDTPLDLVDMLQASHTSDDQSLREDVRRNLRALLSFRQDSRVRVTLGGFPLVSFNLPLML
jgi:hypothetical protein